MRLTNETRAVDAFAAVARAVILEYFPRRNSCIASSRIAIECLRRFRVRARAHPCSFFAQAVDYEMAFACGYEEILKHSTSNVVRLNEPDGWPGHLIVTTRRHFIDPTFDHAVELLRGKGVPIEEEATPFIFAAPMPEPLTPDFRIRLELSSQSGVHLKAGYDHLADDSWRSAPAWETDHLEPVIEEIVELMKEKLV